MRELYDVRGPARGDDAGGDRVRDRRDSAEHHDGSFARRDSCRGVLKNSRSQPRRFFDPGDLAGEQGGEGVILEDAIAGVLAEVAQFVAAREEVEGAGREGFGVAGVRDEGIFAVDDCFAVGGAVAREDEATGREGFEQRPGKDRGGSKMEVQGGSAKDFAVLGGGRGGR